MCMWLVLATIDNTQCVFVYNSVRANMELLNGPNAGSLQSRLHNANLDINAMWNS